MTTKPAQTSDWKLLAEKASKETDPDKLMDLITELNRVLLEQEETTRRKRQGKPSVYGAGA